MTKYTLRTLCVKNDWFTAGDNNQYSSLFEMLDNGAPIHDLALIIWICSADATIEEIEKVLSANWE